MVKRLKVSYPIFIAKSRDYGRRIKPVYAVVVLIKLILIGWE